MKQAFYRGAARVSLSILLCSIAAWLTGCVGLATAPSVPTATLVAQPSTVGYGQTTTLTWTTTNSMSTTINNGVGAVQQAGSISVALTQTTTYVISVSGPGGQSSAQATITVTPPAAPVVAISASPSAITTAESSVLTVTASNATQVVVTDNVDSTSITMPGTGGTATVTPKTTTIYTATATGVNNQTATASTTVTVSPASFSTSVSHIIFMMQENRTFDEYFGMLNPYREANGYNVGADGNTYDIDGIDDKLTKFTNVDDEGQSFGLFKLKSTCIDDDSSAWLQSFGDVNTYNFATTRPILMNGFVHVAENYAKDMSGAGAFTDTVGQRAMGYYDQGFLNYYYYMASQFAVSDRWFSPVADETIPNRIATMTGGTTQGLVHDPGSNEDNLGVLLNIKTIFQELDTAGVSWKIYYTTTEDQCLAADDDCGAGSSVGAFPATTFTYFKYSTNYLYLNPTHGPCTAPTENSGTAVGDPNNAFCIDINKIAPLSQYFTDVANGTLPSFAWIDPGYSNNDEHPGSGQSVLKGQVQVSSVIGSLMTSPSWANSILFFAYDEGGGPFEHVPPVPGKTNINTDASLGVTTDISSIAVNPDGYFPCLPPVAGMPTLHCDLHPSDPGAVSTDAPAVKGFAAQLGFRVPNFVVSPFTRAHYVSHTPIDHTAIIKLVESLFIGSSANLTARDAAQPDLSEFFDFTNVPWSTPPTPPAPVTATSLGYNPCTPTAMGP